MKTYSIVALAAFWIAASALAVDYIELDRDAQQVDQIEIQRDGTLRHVEVISRETNVPVNVIEEQRTRTGLGYGGLLIGNSIAAETGRSFDEIAVLKQSGRGWGEIARQYNVKLGPIVSRVHRVDAAFRGEKKLKHDEKKAAKFVNGHDARDGKWDGTGPGHGHGNGKAKGKVKGHGKD